MTEMTDEQARLAAHISEKLWPHVRAALGGQGAVIQGAVLADLVSIWLAGHRMPDKRETKAFRDKLLAMHVDLVRKLLPANEAALRSENGRQQH